MLRSVVMVVPFRSRMHYYTSTLCKSIRVYLSIDIDITISFYHSYIVAMDEVA